MLDIWIRSSFNQPASPVCCCTDPNFEFSNFGTQPCFCMVTQRCIRCFFFSSAITYVQTISTLNVVTPVVSLVFFIQKVGYQTRIWCIFFICFKVIQHIHHPRTRFSVSHCLSRLFSLQKGFTPLHVAAKYGSLDVAKLLLKRHSPPDSAGKVFVTLTYHNYQTPQLFSL